MFVQLIEIAQKMNSELLDSVKEATTVSCYVNHSDHNNAFVCG